MKKIMIISVTMMFWAFHVVAQKQEDLQGLRQIADRYSYVLEKDDLMKQVQEMGPSSNMIIALKQKYADVIAQNPNDSITLEINRAEQKLQGFLSYIDSRFPLNQIKERVMDYLGDAMRDGRNGKIMKEDPDYIWSGTWSDTKNHIRDANIAIEVLKLKVGPNDTGVINNYQLVKKCEADLEVLKAETRPLLPPKKPIAPLPDIYKGADKESLKAKIKTMFAEECQKYSITKVYLVSEGWERVTGVRWDDMSKSFRKYDRSSLEVDIICVKKGEANPTKGFLVSYTLEKDNISGKVYDTVLCDYLEDRVLDLGKTK